MESPEKNKLPMDELISQLNALQLAENEGRGVSVIKSVIASLKRGDVDAAMREASLDHDKIRNYPEINELLVHELFNGTPLHQWVSPSS